MKALLVGLGSAGFSWYKRLRERGLLAAVVESNETMKGKIGNDPFPFYTTLDEALEQEKVDFLVNVTPPAVHTYINHLAFDHKLPVLCEKPISFNYEESVDVVRRAKLENIPFMIAENYRRWPYVRKLKQILKQGRIGELSVIDVSFYRYHQVTRNYTVHLLRDISIHHFDMIRYLSGKEGCSIQAKLYNPVGGWREDGAVMNANAFIDMEGGIRAGYTASIASRGRETPWSGNWRIEGTEGALELLDQQVYLIRNGVSEQVDEFSDIDSSDTLTEFLSAMEEQRDFETNGLDYLKNEAWVHYAEQSDLSRRMVEILSPDI